MLKEAERDLENLSYSGMKLAPPPAARGEAVACRGAATAAGRKAVILILGIEKEESKPSLRSSGMAWW